VFALGLQAGEHALDLCAAPGNKLAMLADQLHELNASSAQQDAAAAATAGAGSVTGVDWSYSRLAAARSLVRKLGCRSVRLFLADGQTFAEPPPTREQTASSTFAAAHIVDLTHASASSSATAASASSSSGELASASTFHAAETRNSSSLRVADAGGASVAASVASVVLRMSKREKRALHKQAAREAWNKRQKLENGAGVASAASGSDSPAEPADGVPSPAAAAADVSLSSSPPDPMLYDRVLVDAECSHDGSAKHTARLRASAAVGTDPAASTTAAAANASPSPDEKVGASSSPDDWRSLHSPERLASLQLLQRNLLRQGFRMLRPGGTLVYSTCSFQRAQNEDVVAWLLRTEPDAARAVGVWDGIEGVTVEGAKEAAVANSPAAQGLRAASETEEISLLSSRVESAQLHDGGPSLRYLRVFSTSASLPALSAAASASTIASSSSAAPAAIELGIRMDGVLSGTSGLFVAKLRKLPLSDAPSAGAVAKS
jgi:16S rRNA C967 or C1407 C5-methylase (RsmB/RsmF family)